MKVRRLLVGLAVPCLRTDAARSDVLTDHTSLSGGKP
jgi:hypothetical protein